MRHFIVAILLLLTACATIKAPEDFVNENINAEGFIIATWQKNTSPDATIKIYIEGDGHAFNSHGLPTSDPSPKGEMMRELAYGDNSLNVVYMGRVCQYQKSARCDKKYWTDARFAPEVIKAHYQVIKQIARGRPIILIGFSGGAQIAGLLAATTDLRIKKVITIAGNLDHKAWTDWQKLPSLKASLNLANYRDKFKNIPQFHYSGGKDKVIPPLLTYRFVDNNELIFKVENAEHNRGWDKIYPLIWREK